LMCDCPIIKREAWPWTRVGNVFEMYHAPFTLKIFFVYFENKTRRNVIASNTSQSFFHW
jgi:hypothetical protein